MLELMDWSNALVTPDRAAAENVHLGDPPQPSFAPQTERA